MGNESSSVVEAGGVPEAVSVCQLSHLGEVTVMRQGEQYCLLKVFSYSDGFLMEDRHRKLRSRTSKLADNAHVLNILQVVKRQRHELCANNYQLAVYLQRPELSLGQAIARRLSERRNYTEEELYAFLGKVVESLLYMQDNGLKNIQLDSEAVLFCGEQVKILDSGLACSRSYAQLLERREKGEGSSRSKEEAEGCVYLAPQLLRMNYDPYISPKADVFSLGMMVLEMIALESMQGYYDYSRAEIDYDSLIHRLSRITHALPLKTLLAEMLEQDPEERIGLLSLKEKLQRLRAHNPSGITRSKSSKMLQEILSQSRRSSSICKQSEQSGGLSRQPSSEKKLPVRIELRSSVRKEQSQGQSQGQGRPETEPTVAPLTNRREDLLGGKEEISYSQSNLRNLVRNKLGNRGVVKENSNKLMRPFKKETPVFQEKPKTVEVRALTTHNENVFESSMASKLMKGKSRQFDSSIKSRQSQTGVRATLKKLVEESDTKKILKLQHLQINSQSRSQNESLRNTSRFGSTQNQNVSPVKQITSRSRMAEIYIQEEREDEYTVEIDEFRSVQQQSEKTLQKVMTFNKEVLINARSVEESLQYANKALEEQSRSNLAFSPINSNVNNERSLINDSSYKNITIKDVPVVISQEKVYLGVPPSVSFGKLQRQLNLLECIESVQQGSSLNSSFNASKVIQSYRPNDQEYQSMKNEPLPYEPSLFKKRPKKPQLMIRLQDEQNSQSPTKMPLTLQQKSTLENLYKTTRSIEHLSNFTSISPQQVNKESKATLNYGSSPDFEEEFNNRVTLPNGMQYQGEMMGELPHGNGILYSNGRILFSGTFQYGRYHGYGTLHNLEYVQGVVDHKLFDLSRGYWLRFEGEFLEGLMNGFGTLLMQGKEKFSGCFKMGVIEGYGCFYKRSGELVSGLWSENAFQRP